MLPMWFLRGPLLLFTRYRLSVSSHGLILVCFAWGFVERVPYATVEISWYHKWPNFDFDIQPPSRMEVRTAVEANSEHEFETVSVWMIRTM